MSPTLFKRIRLDPNNLSHLTVNLSTGNHRNTGDIVHGTFGLLAKLTALLSHVSIRMAKAYQNAGHWRAAYTFLEKAIMYDDQATAKFRETVTDTQT